MDILLLVLSLYIKAVAISGLVIATVSAFLFSVILVALAEYGYLLEKRLPSIDLFNLAVILGAPLIGTAVGSALFYFYSKTKM